MSNLNAIQRIFKFTGLEKGFGWVFFSLGAGVVIGSVLDRSETNKMIIYRDRSALYGRELKEGEKPSWPSKETYLN